MQWGFERLAAALFCVMCLLAGPTAAQGLFSSVITINDRIVTRYQLDQRTAFLSLLGLRENARETALNQLSIEALQLWAAEQAGVGVPPEAIEAGQAEFAARGNLNRDQLLTVLAQGGIDPATFDDFVRAGLIWREYVRQRFADEASAIPRDVLRRALETADLEADRRVLLSEIILPANTPQARQVSLERARAFAQIRDIEAFGVAASQYSLAQTRFRNGEVAWRPQSALPEQIRNAIANLQPGQSSRPVEFANSVSVYFLRDVELIPATTSAFAAIEYAALQLPSGADAGRVLAGLDRCQDLEAKSNAYPENAFVRETRLLTTIPGDLRAVLDTLDQGETTVVTRSGAGPRVVILCQRTFGEGAEIDLSLLQFRLEGQRLQLLAERHLRELRDAAVVIRPEDG